MTVGKYSPAVTKAMDRFWSRVERERQEARHHFQNRLRILRSIDGYEVRGISDEAGFLRSPYEFFIRCSEEDSDLIFEALLKREPRYEGEK